MSFVDGNNSGFYMPVAPAYNGGYGGGMGNCWGDNSMWWFIVLILAMNGGWGNGFGNNGGAMPYFLNQNTDSSVQRGFDQQSVMSGINGINSTVANGFSNVQQSLCGGFAGVNATVNGGFAAAEASENARQIANMQNNFAMQTAMQQGFNQIGSQFANCCCENRLGTADLKATVLAENCEDRNALNNGLREVIVNNTANTQRIVDTTNDGFRGLYDKLCQIEQDSIKRDYENRISALQNALDAERQANQNARFDASQNSQTAAIQAGQRTLANEIEQYVLPQPRPAYIVQNPNCCPNGGYGYGSACGY